MPDQNFNTSAPVSQGQFRRWRRWGVVAWVFLFGTSAGVYQLGSDEARKSRAAIVVSGRVVAVEGCNRDFKSLTVARKTLDAQRAGLKVFVDDGTITQAGYDKSVANLDKLEPLLTAPDCRKVAALLTDDPRDTRFPPPFPLYPGSPDAP